MKRVFQVLYLVFAVQGALISGDQPKDGWVEKTEIDKVTDSMRVYMSLIADHQALNLSNWLNLNWPRLVVGCEDKQNFFAVAISSPAKLDPLARASVITRFGNFKPVAENWESAGGGTLLRMLAEPINAAVALTTTDKVLFRYTPKEGRDVTLEFSIFGAKDHLPRIAQACGWDYARALRQLH